MYYNSVYILGERHIVKYKSTHSVFAMLIIHFWLVQSLVFDHKSLKNEYKYFSITYARLIANAIGAEVRTT